MVFTETAIAVVLKEGIMYVKNFFTLREEWIVMNQDDFSKSSLKTDLEKEGYRLRFAVQDKIEGHKSKGYEIIKRTVKKRKKIYMYNDGRGSVLMGKKVILFET